MSNKKTYEFKVVTDLSSEELNQLGSQGFRLVTVNKSTKDNNSLLYYLEREIDNVADVKDNTANETIKSAFDYPNFVETYKRSIWHTPYEEPQTEVFVKCLVEFEYDYYDGRVFKVCDYHKNCGFATTKGWVKLDKVVRWAYMSDIVLPYNEIMLKEKTKISLNGVAQPYKLFDLGLPSGTLWMDRNVGSSSPTDYGKYFAFNTAKGYYKEEVKGNMFTETWYKSQKKVDWTNYFFEDGTHAPTKEQIQELMDNTTFEWTTMNGVNGGLFTSKINGNSIFIPAAGICYNSSVGNVGGHCALLSSSLCEDYPADAWKLYFGSGGMYCDYNNKYYGQPVRGVVKV